MYHKLDIIRIKLNLGERGIVEFSRFINNQITSGISTLSSNKMIRFVLKRNGLVKIEKDGGMIKDMNLEIFNKSIEKMMKTRRRDKSSIKLLLHIL